MCRQNIGWQRGKHIVTRESFLYIWLRFPQYWDFFLGEFKYWAAEDAETIDTKDWNAFAAIFILIWPLCGIGLLLLRFLLKEVEVEASFTLVLILWQIYFDRELGFLFVLWVIWRWCLNLLWNFEVFIGWGIEGWVWIILVRTNEQFLAGQWGSMPAELFWPWKILLQQLVLMIDYIYILAQSTVSCFVGYYKIPMFPMIDWERESINGKCVGINFVWVCLML